MKKILLAVTAALAITSCSQNEEFENEGQKTEINFTTIVSKATRASELKTEGLKTNGGFKVFAYNTKNNDMSAETILGETPFMNGVIVSWNSSAWTMNPCRRPDPEPNAAALAPARTAAQKRSAFFRIGYHRSARHSSPQALHMRSHLLLLLLLLVFLHAVEDDAVRAHAVVETAVDAADGRAGSAGLFQNVVVDQAVIQKLRQLKALLHGLELGKRAKISKEIIAFLDSLELENGAVELAVRIRVFISIVQDKISPLLIVGFRRNYGNTLTLESKVVFYKFVAFHEKSCPFLGKTEANFVLARRTDNQKSRINARYCHLSVPRRKSFSSSA